MVPVVTLAPMVFFKSSSARHHAESAVPRVELFRCHALLLDKETSASDKETRRWDLDRAFYHQTPVKQDVHFFKFKACSDLRGMWKRLL